MKPLLERLCENKPLIADGAVGTMLLERGLEPGACPETVNLERPEILEEIAGLYLEAGAELIVANTFGASPLKLAFYGLEDKTEEINRQAILALRRGVGERAYVSASCGPCGKLLRPHGDAEPDEVYESYRRQMRAVIGAGVDCVCIETMVDLSEATLAVKAAKDVAPAIPVTATMTFDPTPRGFHTIMGVNIEQAASGLQEAGAEVIGSNCGNGIENMIEIAAVFRARTDWPLIIQPNAGLPQTKGGRTVYGETPTFMAEKARTLVTAGVAVIGGCCGTTPEHIRAIREMVEEEKVSKA